MAPARSIVLISSAAALAMVSAGCGLGKPPGQALLDKTRARHAAVLEHPANASPEAVEAAVKALERVGRKKRGLRAGAQAVEAIGLLRLARDEHEQARKAFEHIAEAPTTAWGAKARGFLALVYRTMGRAEDEARVQRELDAVERNVGRPDVLYALARVYGRVLDDPARARALYTRTAEEFPDDPLAPVAVTERGQLPPAP